MLLSFKTFEYIVEQQKKLDRFFSEHSRWVPDARDRQMAIIGERGELYNEFTHEVRWWKHKDNSSKNIIDECMDAWHFGASIVYQDFQDTAPQRVTLYGMISDEVERYRRKLEPFPEEERVKELLWFHGTEANDWIRILAIQTLFLELLDFEDQDMKLSYDEMNKKNYERIAQGY